MAESPVLVVQQVECEGPGLLGKCSGGRPLKVIRVDLGEPVPPTAEGFAGLVVLGGPMNVDETARYPFLDAEKELVQWAITSELPVLGLCLGSQLIARVLGAHVRKAPRSEIGFLRVDATPEAQSDPLMKHFPPFAQVFQWHSDTFDLPLGAVRLASSRVCENQAFRWGEHVWGFQFHLEVTPPMAFKWSQLYETDLARNPDMDVTTLRKQFRDNERFTKLAEISTGVFGTWFKMLK